MKRSRVILLLVLLLAAPGAGFPAPPARLELTHPVGGHEVHVSAPAVAAAGDGQPLLAGSPPAPTSTPSSSRARAAVATRSA
jgi:hypothetical protein